MATKPKTTTDPTPDSTPTPDPTPAPTPDETVAPDENPPVTEETAPVSEQEPDASALPDPGVAAVLKVDQDRARPFVLDEEPVDLSGEGVTGHAYIPPADDAADEE